MHINLGASPHGEPCAQVGSDNYSEIAREELRRYKALLLSLFEKEHGREPKCRLATKSFPHDLGTYHELVAFFTEDDEGSEEDAFWFDNNVPELWPAPEPTPEDSELPIHIDNLKSPDEITSLAEQHLFDTAFASEVQKNVDVDDATAWGLTVVRKYRESLIRIEQEMYELAKDRAVEDKITREEMRNDL